MTTYTVTKVRKEKCSVTGYKHIEGVITSAGVHYTRKEVVDSIDKGNTWRTSSGGYSATIVKMTYCPNGTCTATPYIKTKPDSDKQDNLENLPEG